MPEFPKISYIGDILRFTILNKYIPEGKGLCCDFGAGNGQYFHLINSKGYDYLGYDIEPRNESIKHLDLMDLEGELPKCDIAICVDVLEHLSNPKKGLKNIHSMLKKGGILYLHTPNSSQSHILFDHPHQEDHKVDGFSYVELSYMATQAGFNRPYILLTFSFQEMLAWEIVNLERFNKALEINRLLNFDLEKFNNGGWLLIAEV